MRDTNPASGKETGFTVKDFDAGLMQFAAVISAFGRNCAGEESSEEGGRGVEFKVFSLWPGQCNGEFE